ncbi:MAG TPA: winged helix-turn-helix domain-containing protein [Pyrinomonadaceae bacterium]|nr:winged helix-turn-helix domain-containing protein [Pyrinomonadaceae bacterium]
MKNVIGKQFYFDEFEVDSVRRILLKRGKNVALNPKAFDLLVVLIERRGEIISKSDLLDAVWENQFVEEKNLTVHVAALRKAFGERKNENRFIATIPGTGYKFVAPLNDPGNEIIIETEKIERITIEEEEELGRRGVGEKQSRQSLSKILLISLSPLLLFSLFDGYVWQNSRQKPNSVISVKRLTTNGKVKTAALSPDGKLFAYVADDLGQTSLWLGYTAGGNNIQLRPPGEAVYGQLTFSPDSSQLYFSMRDERNPETSLYRMPAFGGVPEKLAAENDFSLSPDGKEIAFGRGGRDGKVSLMVSALNGDDEREILSVPQAQTFVDGSVSWSPDKKRMAFSCQRESEFYFQDLCLADVSNGNIERITLPNYRSILKTAWLKSNDGVIVTAIHTGNNSSVVNFQILNVELPNGNIREITNDLNTYNSDISIADDSKSLLTIEHRQLNNVWVAPSDNLSQAKQITFGSFGKYDGLWGLDWTPDGRIIFTNSSTDTQHISAMNADGNERKDLTSPGFMDSALTVSNDGRYVVFHSIRGGATDIWRMDIDGGNLKQLTFENKSFQPSVSPDNRYVYYKCWLNAVGELRRVPIDGGEPEILTDKETAWTTFSPDGKFFAAVYRTDKRRLAIFSAETNQIIKQFDLPKTAYIDMRPRWTPDSRSVVYRDLDFGYWSQSIEGGEPKRLEALPKEKLFTFAWSKDGKQFAFVRGQEIRDVILISHFR